MSDLPFSKEKQLGKRKTVKQLDKKLWKIFSRYIRCRDANKDGIAQCISCGKPMQVWYPNGKWNQQCHAGHFYNRGSSYRAIKYDEKNVNAQCCHCNTFNEGNKQGYKRGLIKKYGEGVLEYLAVKKSNRVTWGHGVLHFMIKEYQQKLKREMEKKGIE